MGTARPRLASKPDMARVISSILLILVCCLVPVFAAGSPIAGKWSCVSTDELGNEIPWTLVVKDDAGKLTGSVIFAVEGLEVAILEPALNGHSFTFKIQPNPRESVELTMQIDGAKLEGKFKGKLSGTGTVKGTRLS
jgi:hypothetical protein